MFTLDTNILIYYAAEEKGVADLLLRTLEKGEMLYLPSVVVTEFLSYPPLSDQEKKFFSESVRYFEFVALDYAIAVLAGEIRQKYGLRLGDSVVAATALSTKSTLLTRNVRDFKKVAGLKLQKA